MNYKAFASMPHTQAPVTGRAGKRNAIALVFLAPFLAGQAALLPLAAGQKAPAFANPALDGSGYLFSKDFYGKGFVIVDFFSTTCEPCKEELPLLDALIASYPEGKLRGLVFALDTDSSPKAYFAAHPSRFSVALDRYRVCADRFGVTEIPAVFLVAPDGTIAWSGVGRSGADPAAIEAILDRALK